MVAQVMNLLQLPAEIQAGLLRPPAPLKIHSFSERSCGCSSRAGMKKPERPAGVSLSRNSRVLPATEPRYGGFGRCSAVLGEGCRLAYLGSLGSQEAIRGPPRAVRSAAPPECAVAIRRSAKMDDRVPGGPISRTLCEPAAAISNAPLRIPAL